jgi:hypothetical protein
VKYGASGGPALFRLRRLCDRGGARGLLGAVAAMGFAKNSRPYGRRVPDRT